MTTTLTCDCNATMPLRVPGSDGTVHTALCRRDAAAFQKAARTGDDLLVACTQEQRLFTELAAHTEGAPDLSVRPIRFVNLRETGGWSEASRRDPKGFQAKAAALLAAAALPAPDPVGVVSYRSSGRLLITGPATRVQDAADLLKHQFEVQGLVTSGGRLAQVRELPVQHGQGVRVQGWLGQFKVTWSDANPIDTDVCTRCNACITACPEGAIGHDYQVDLNRCVGHRACVQACEGIGAIQFDRTPRQVHAEVDLVLDVHDQPLILLHQPPQGYVHAATAMDMLMAMPTLHGWVGEFEKPRFFQYKQKSCAHSRNERIGCQACVEVCSAEAISSDATRKGRLPGEGPGVVVSPHLCVGCGACSTVCPSGAMSYATPTASHLGRHLQVLLKTYLKAGGSDPVVLLHNAGAGREALLQWGRQAMAGAPGEEGGKTRRLGLPHRVLPVEVQHVASVGLDLWLTALAHGAVQVWVLVTEDDAPAYRLALTQQMAVGQAVLTAMGYAGTHLSLMDSASPAELDQRLHLAPAQGVAQPATFQVMGDKRATLDQALDHLARHAPKADADAAPWPLPRQGSPWGTVAVDTSRCTLCLSCVGACPSSALMDNPDRPELRFVEKNCVQCGLCVSTCPESALTLVPQLDWREGGQRRQQVRALHAAEPWRCVKCSKPFGTVQAIMAMQSKLSSHPMFQGAAAERLLMCGDCRVIDLHTNPHEVRITDL